MEEDDRNEKIHKLLLGQRAMSLEEDQAEVMQAILNSDKPLLHVSALAGMGKSVVLGLLMWLSADDGQAGWPLQRMAWTSATCGLGARLARAAT